MKHTYGAELEKSIANTTTAQTHKVSQQFFKRLHTEAIKRDTFDHDHKSDIDPSTILGVVSKDLGEQGVDNGFNLLETALPYQASLKKLYDTMLLDLKTTQSALKQEHATVINFSNHPLATTDIDSYKNFVAPKGIYKYIWSRGWDHSAGIDAKAQNSPTTGVDVYQAADAVSVIIGAGAAFIALFGNSPFREGTLSGYKESRLTMWERMMGNSKVKGDLTTARFPEQRFRTLAQYFRWMFGKGTGIHFVVTTEMEGYKSTGNSVVLIENNPPLLEYLAKKEATGYMLDNLEQKVKIKPDISHMEMTQFAQFAGARVRYMLKKDIFPLHEFVEACDAINETKVEDLFSKYAHFTYIEGRDPGANFPDKELIEVDSKIANTTMIGPAALQAGLIQNLGLATTFIDSFNWKELEGLRQTAIKSGLDDKKVYDFTKKIVELAHDGLKTSDKSLLRYAEHVLRSKQNGADRALRSIKDSNKSISGAIKQLVIDRGIII